LEARFCVEIYFYLIRLIGLIGLIEFFSTLDKMQPRKQLDNKTVANALRRNIISLVRNFNSTRGMERLFLFEFERNIGSCRFLIVKF